MKTTALRYGAALDYLRQQNKVDPAIACSAFFRNVFAEYDRRGSLSDKQWAVIHAEADTVSGKVDPAPHVECPRTERQSAPVEDESLRRAQEAIDAVNRIMAERGVDYTRPDYVPRAETIHKAEAPKKPDPIFINVGSMERLNEMFVQSAKHLKHPAIRLQLRNGMPFVLSPYGGASRYHGSINLTDGQRYPLSYWFGRVSASGVWGVGTPLLALTPQNTQRREEVEALLRRLSDDPVAVTAEYGRLMGQCCFCNRRLEDERSTSVGYGPVCAKHFGLPWGERAKAFECT